MKDAILNWREIDRVKAQLVEEHLDFNLIDAFEALDKNRKGFVTALDLVECLDDIKILDMPDYCQESQVKMFINEFVSKRSEPGTGGRMRFVDFA